MNTTINNTQFSHTTGANGSYLTCKRHSNLFARFTAVLTKALQKKKEIVDAMNEKPAPFKVIMSVLAILVGVGLACIEAANISTTIAASTGMSNVFANIVGALFACLGMLAGEMVSNGKRDEFTGKLTFSAPQFFGAVLIIIYLGGQYFIASRAEIGAGDMQYTVHTMTYFILGIAVIEVLFGALFFKTAIQVFTMLFFTIRIRLIGRRLDRTSRNTEESWQRHLFEVQTYNDANQTTIAHGEETPSIRNSRDYYNNGGFANDSNNNL